MLFSTVASSSSSTPFFFLVFFCVPVLFFAARNAYALDYDCVCECCLPGQCELGTRKHTFNVGDPQLCTTNMCASNVASCPDSGSHNAGGTNIATYLDCSCACCKDSNCPTLITNAFHSGSIQKCRVRVLVEVLLVPRPGGA